MARIDVLLKCRDLGHDWDEYLRKIRDAGWGRHRILRCGGCSAERTEIINIHGEIDQGSRNYTYPDDYWKVSQLSKVEARKLRLERLNGTASGGIAAELSKRRDSKDPKKKKRHLKAVS